MLVIDIGNSNVKLGFFKSDISSLKVEVFNSVEDIPELNIDYIVYSSVSPSKEKEVFRKIKAEKIEEINPLEIKSMKFKYTPIFSLGKDRVAVAYGGFKLYGGDSLIVDLGTAITFDFVDGNGVFKGGMILPGPQTVLDCLKLKTEKVKVNVFSPLTELGNSTVESVNSAITNAILGIIERLYKKSKAKRVIVTGGYFSIFENLLKGFDIVYDKWLVLKGLYFYGRRQKQ